jgi:hypothetical protein
MDQRVTKLNHRLGNRTLAAKLVAAGLGTPKAIKAATDKQLKAIPDVGDATVAIIRERIG